jgi:hypothetical protein
MARVVPSKPRFKSEDVCRCWMAFSYDDDEGGHTIRRGVKLLGSHNAVQRCPWAFVLNSDPTDAEPSPHSIPPDPDPQPRFLKPTRLKARVRILMGASAFEPGSEFTAPAATAEWLVSENYADPV